MSESKLGLNMYFCTDKYGRLLEADFKNIAVFLFHD